MVNLSIYDSIVDNILGNGAYETVLRSRDELWRQCGEYKVQKQTSHAAYHHALYIYILATKLDQSTCMWFARSSSWEDFAESVQEE